MKFRYNQKVKIRKGFYKSYKGIIKEIKEENKTNISYIVEVLLGNENVAICTIKEDDMRELKGLEHIF